MLKKSIILAVIYLLNPIIPFAQTLTQSIRGTILDADSRMPLIGVTVKVVSPFIGSTTDLNGNFVLPKVPIGRVNLILTYVGYENVEVSNVLVNSAKETILNLSMKEYILKLDEVAVLVNKNNGEPLNEMALASSRSISPEEINRYAGGFNDPSRILSNFAGVTNTQDGSNDIIVRGNSPKYVQWRLEGTQINNPNHFADMAAVSGSISALNNNVVATSDFHTGAFPAEYGDVLSGVYDIGLRTGNNKKYEGVFGFGLSGIDLTLEGPFKKGYNGSFLVNYRYSTISILDKLGALDALNGSLNFQDATVKLVFPTKKAGSFTLYGLGGKSNFELIDVTPSSFDTPGDRGLKSDIFEDFNKNSQLYNTGLKHVINIGKNSFLNSSATYSYEGLTDNIFETKLLTFSGRKDSLINLGLNYYGKSNKQICRLLSTFHHKFNAQHTLQIGSNYNLFLLDINQSNRIDDTQKRINLLSFNGEIETWRNFINYKYRVSDRFSIVAGLHNMNVLYNQKSTLEPRVAMSLQVGNHGALQIGYGNHSNMESVQHYLVTQTDASGKETVPNKDLGLLRADHYLIGYENRFAKNFRAKIEVYYQDLYNLPVENNPDSYFSTIVESSDFRYAELVNKGKGRNYGVELTLEKFLSNNFYFLLNGSLFESKYTALDGIERNTPFNSKYLANFLAGKEFIGLGRKKNRTIGVNAKAFYAGGRRIIPLLRDSNGNLAVQPDKNLFWDYSKAFEDKLDDQYQIIVSANYKWNRQKTTHEIFLNFDNVTNRKGKISEFYDKSEPNSIGYLTQFGIFPNLLYRVYF